MKWCNR